MRTKKWQEKKKAEKENIEKKIKEIFELKKQLSDSEIQRKLEITNYENKICELQLQKEIIRKENIRRERKFAHYMATLPPCSRRWADMNDECDDDDDTTTDADANDGPDGADDTADDVAAYLSGLMSALDPD